VQGFRQEVQGFRQEVQGFREEVQGFRVEVWGFQVEVGFEAVRSSAAAEKPGEPVPGQPRLTLQLTL